MNKLIYYQGLSKRVFFKENLRYIKFPITIFGAILLKIPST